MKFYREWCSAPHTRKGSMMPVNMIARIANSPNIDTGYASVYYFDENAANAIILSRSSSGLGRFDVYTDELVIDLDSGDEQLALTERVLKERGLSYTVWASGGKGYHIYIRLSATMMGNNVPYSQKKYVESLGIKADLSLYQHGRILSLPGRVHPKTGVRKHRVKRVRGSNVLTIPLLTPPEPVFRFDANGGLGDLEAGLWSLISMLGQEPDVGNRHTALWSAALHFADAGVSYATTLELITEVNSKWECSKDGDGITLAVKQAYKTK